MGKNKWSVKLLSLALAVCLLIGMLPAGVITLPVFAAEATTADNVQKVMDYAENLLNSNYSKAETVTQAKADAFTWDTEGKTDDWRYFNGVMLDAFMMLGLDTTSGNALEFLETFMDHNIESNGTITKWHPNEVDSVPPAYAMMYLLGSAVDDDKYEDAAHFVYNELKNQYSYTNCGGNFLHKQTGVGTGTGSSGWTEWNIGLDGLYMAQPFLMAYANALEDNLISNTNNVSYSDIYQAVYDRFIWVANNMYDETTKLYHHGYSVNGTTVNGVSTHVNGQFWGRGIGWYAVGLVEVIDRMPEGTNKTNLIAALKKLFDGMLLYQDESTGMWCNLVNVPAGTAYTENDKTYYNKLETSVTSLMSYALLKAYNEGWVTDNKYGQAGLDAFNGIVNNKLQGGKFIDIYMKSGVGTTEIYYCKESYATDEGKGVGGILMAAAEALETEAKLSGGSFEEEYTVGIVAAPSDLVVIEGTTVFDTSEIVATVVSNQGSVKTVPGNALTYEVDGTTVTASYAGVEIDTFTVNVVAADATASATGSLIIGSTESAPTGGTTSDSEQVTVTESSTDALVCTLSESTGVQHTSDSFVTVVELNKDTKEEVNPKWKTDCTITYDEKTISKPLKMGSQTTVTVDTRGKGVGTLTLVLCTNNDDTGTEIKVDGTAIDIGDDGIVTISNLTDDTTHTITRTSKEAHLGFVIFTPNGTGGGTYDVSLTTESSGRLLNKGEVIVPGAKLSATLNGETASVSGDIIWDSSNDEVASVDDNGNVTAEGAGDATITAKVTEVTIGGSEQTVDLEVTIPVKVVETQVHTVSVEANPGAASMAVNNYKWVGVSVYVDGNYTTANNIVYSSNNESVATFSGNIYSVSPGSTTVYATVNSVNYNNTAYEIDPIVVPIPVVVTGTETYSIVTVDAAMDSIQVGGTTNVSAIVSNGTHAVEDAKVTWSSSNEAVATVNDSGVVTAKSVGTVTITASSPTRAASDTASVTITVTPKATSGDSSGDADVYTVEYTDQSIYSYTYGFGPYGYVVVKKNGEQIFSGYTLNITINGTAVSSADNWWGLPGEIKTETSYPVVVTLFVDNTEVASDTGTVTVIPANYWTESKTASASVAKDQKLTFTLSGTLSDASYGGFDDLKLWNDNGTPNDNSDDYEVSITNGDFESGTDSWTLSVLSGTTSNSSDFASNGNYLNLWIGGTGDQTVSAVYEITAPEAGTYYCTYRTSGGNVDGISGTLTAAQTHEHNYTPVVTAPTCTEQGYTTYTCSCGYTYEGDYVAATGHNYSSVVTAPTCTAQGYTTHTCANCGDKYTDNYVAATGHNYVDGTCSVCGAAQPSSGTFIYDLDTDGVDAGEEYVILAIYDGKYYALTHDGSKYVPVEVTVSGGKVTIPCATAGDYEWLVEAVEGGSTVTAAGINHTAVQISNNGEYVNDEGASPSSSAQTIYVGAVNAANGQYHLYLETVDEGFNSLCLSNDSKWARKTNTDSGIAESCILYFFKVSHWVDASAGFRAEYSEEFQLGENIQTWTFTSTTDADAANNWDSALLELRVGGNAYALVRSDAYAWYDGGDPIAEYGTEHTLTDWTDWREANKAGTEVKVTAQLVNNNIVVAISNAGITNTYVIPYSGTEVDLYFTGENCVLDNCQTSSAHIDIADAVEYAKNFDITSTTLAQNQISISYADVTTGSDGTRTISREAIDKALGGTGDSANPYQLPVTLTYSDGTTSTVYVHAFNGGIHNQPNTGDNGDYLVVKAVDPRTGKKGYASIAVTFYTAEASLTVPDVVVFENGTASIAPEVIYDGNTIASGNYDITYTVNSGSELITWNDTTVEGKTAGSVSVTATLNSVTTSTGTYPITGVTYDFKIRVFPNWENRTTTNQVTAKPGDKVSFVFSGTRSQDTNFYMNNLYLWKQGSDAAVGGDRVDYSAGSWRNSNFAIIDWNGFASLSVDGVTLANGTGDIWVPYGIRFARSYDQMSATYDVIVTESGTYYFKYDLLAKTDGNVYDGLSGHVVVASPVADQQGTMLTNFITVDAGTTTISQDDLTAFFNGNGMTIAYTDDTTMTVTTNLSSNGQIKTYNGQDYIDVVWTVGEGDDQVSIQAPVWVQYRVSTSSDYYIHNVSKNNATDPDGFYEISNGSVKSGDTLYGNGNLTYDGEKLTKGIEFGDNTTITLKPTVSGTLTVVLCPRSEEDTYRVVIDGVTYDNLYGENGDSLTEKTAVCVLNIPVDAGTHTIGKGQSSTMELLYVKFTPNDLSYITVEQPDNLVISEKETAQLVPTVVYESVQLAHVNYKIQWTSADPSIVSVDANGVVTAHRTGGVTVTATVIEVNGEPLAEADYMTYQVPVVVSGPALNIQESMHLYSGASAQYSTAITEKSVQVNGEDAETYVIEWSSSDHNVATVDSEGNVKAEGPGTATITAKLTSANGNPLETPVTDTMTVTVEARTVEEAYLNSYEYIAVQGWTENDVKKELQHMVLTIKYNTGEVETIQYDVDDGENGDYDELNGLHVDLEDLDTSKATIQVVDVIYKEGEQVLFEDAIWIHVEEYDLDDFHGTVTIEEGVTYHLDTDGVIEPNLEYVIVPGNDQTIALTNPDLAGNSAATSQAVTINGEQLFINMNTAEMSEWLFDYMVEGDNVDQYHVSNFAHYLGNSANGQILHEGVHPIYLQPVSNGSDGRYYIILGYGRNNQPYYLTYDGTNWTSSTNASSVYLYRKDIERMYDQGVDFTITDPTGTTSENSYNVPLGRDKEIGVLVEVNHVEKTKYTIEWISSDENVAIVDENGVVTPVGTGDVVITARLTQVEHFEVTCNEHDTPYIERTIYLNVTEEDPTGTLLVEDDDPTTAPSNVLEVGINSNPNFSKVYLDMVFAQASDFNYTVHSSELTFDLADAYKVTDATGQTPVLDGENNQIGFDSSNLGYYLVKVTHGEDEYELILNVVEDPYAGLEEATDYPGYPDAGAVRIDKVASGANGMDFNESGVANIELEIAGVSTRSPVDVVLIVDVSNSMAWTDSWFDYSKYTAETLPERFTQYYETYKAEVDADATEEEAWNAWVTGQNIKGDDNKTLAYGYAAEDADKIPTNNAAGIDKLDNAMTAAKEFANILLNTDGGNTLSFVTFAGHDETLSADEKNQYMDSVRTPFVAVSDYATAESVFNATKFTKFTVTTEDNENDTSTTFYLDIGGHESGDPAISGEVSERINRGNTNYDYAFGEAIDAVEAVWETYGGKEAYEETGRQVHVVFMTDGAPSHYNGLKLNGNNPDQTWDQSAEYTFHDPETAAAWLTYIKNPNTLATELKDMVYGAYTVGFDLAHGGFGEYSWNESDMERVLEGLAENAIVPVTMASNATQLNEFYRSLAETLAYAGTSAKVTDVIGSDFTLYTGPQLYASEGADGIPDDFDYVDPDVKAAVSTEISIKSYPLVLASDIGSWKSVIKTDGTIETVQITEEHLGLRVNETPITIETVTITENGTVAKSSLKGDVDILTVDDSGNVTIAATTFTYTNIDGLEKFEWNLGAIAANGSPDGNISDREIVLSYNAYLKGSFNNPQDTDAGIYNTNQYAYLEYVDANGKYAKQNFGMPTMAWKEALVTVRFYLVNEQGQYVNYANVAFSNPANRIFLEERASYSVTLNESITITAQQAAEAIKLSSQYQLYDDKAYVTVYNSPSNQGAYVEQTFVAASTDPVKKASADLIAGIDVLGNGTYVQTIVEIPVILHDLGESERPMEAETVVIDYGKPLPIDAFNATESLYANGYADERDGVEYWYTMEIAGFAPYSAAHDPKDYVPETAFTMVSGTETFDVENGTFSIGANNQIIFTPDTILSDVQKVFIAVKFAEYQVDKVTPTSYFFYMFKEVTVIPATVVYYETDENMAGAFTTAGSGWENKSEGTKGVQQQTDGTIGKQDQAHIYGYDSSYTGDTQYSNGSSRFVAGQGVTTTTAGFTFTGTGFDIIARTGADQGTLRVTITSTTKDFTRTVSVINKGELELYQIPVISVHNLPHGTYTVTIGVYEKMDYGTGALAALNRGNEFYFDAIRIYNPIDTTTTSTDPDREVATDAYQQDNEFSPYIEEVRNMLIDAKDFVDNEVATSDTSLPGIVYLDPTNDDLMFPNVDNITDIEVGGHTNHTTNMVTTYAKIGPNNEVYLSNGQGVAFKLTMTTAAPASFHIGAKTIGAPDVSDQAQMVVDIYAKVDEVLAKVHTMQNVTVGSATSLFYDVMNGVQNLDADLAGLYNANGGEIYVVIKNTGEGVLSITDIKLAYGEQVGAATFSVDADTVAVAADSLILDYDILGTEFESDSARMLRKTTMTVTTTTDVEYLVLTNSYGIPVWHDVTKCVKVAGENGVEVLEWTIVLRPVLLGEQSYTVTGYAEGNSGQYLSDSILVKIY